MASHQPTADAGAPTSWTYATPSASGATENVAISQVNNSTRRIPGCPSTFAFRPAIATQPRHPGGDGSGHMAAMQPEPQQSCGDQEVSASSASAHRAETSSRNRPATPFPITCDPCATIRSSDRAGM